MIVYFVALLLLVVTTIKRTRDDNYFTTDQTFSLKGISIIIVFFNHIITGYLDKSEIDYIPLIDSGFIKFIGLTTQLCVGLFLFCSGYGVLESIKKKGKLYVANIPRTRILGTLINFDIAVLIYLVLNAILGVHYSISANILSLLAWDSIGNSNWYIFAILYCYFTIYLAERASQDKCRVLVIITVLLTVYCVVMSLYKGVWWYNTIFCFEAGCLYSIMKVQVNRLIQSRLLIVTIVASVIFTSTYCFSSNAMVHNLSSIAFSYLCVVLCSKYSIQSRFLKWCGKNLFAIYIYQRIPMICIITIAPSFVQDYYNLYIIICFFLTCGVVKIVPMVRLR